MLIFLHRRHVKKQRIEDANDPHKSLDFGMDMSAPSKLNKNKPGVPEMTITDLGGGPVKPGKHGLHGASLDMDMSNPYLLPAGLQGSRESIHSMSRAIADEHDPYRPVGMVRSSTESSRPRMDNASTYSASTNHSGHEKANLLRNAQRMSQSNPARRVDSMSPHNSKSAEELATRQMHSNNRSMPPSRKTSLASTDLPLRNITETSPPPRKQSLPKSLPQPPPPSEAVVEQPPPRSSSASRSTRKSSASVGAKNAHASLASETSNYGNIPPVPTVNEPSDLDYDIDPSMIHTGRYSIDTPNLSQQYPVQPLPRRTGSVMGLRPLPSNLPEDNPEVRANRIRSFYKEYFDDSRPNPANGQYAEDPNAGYMDGAIYDPETGGFIMAGRPFAQPVGRRAMTPPPRGAPRTGGPHRRQFSTQSAGRPGQARGRPGPGPPPPMPKKRAPPPKALQGLPTPHMFKDFDSVISSPIDFAPPTSFRAMQNGSPSDSPAGTPRAYSPSVKAFNPLATAFDELSAVPSPHMLRKSGTFSALDFAPPPRLGSRDTGSDAGSIRSARSGISAMQMDAVRAGAYRVSRIPKEMVTTREDLAAQLRPKMDMGRA